MTKIVHFVLVFSLWGVFAMSSRSISSFSLDRINEDFNKIVDEFLELAICEYETIASDVMSAKSLASVVLFKDGEKIAATTGQFSWSCKTLDNPTRFQFRMIGLIFREAESQSARNEIFATISINHDTVLQFTEPAVFQLNYPFSVPPSFTTVDYCKVFRISQDETILKCEQPADSCNSFLREFYLDQHMKKWVKAFGQMEELEFGMKQFCNSGITIQLERTLQCAKKMESQAIDTNGQESESSELHFAKEEL